MADTNEYRLLDSGNMMKLEQAGPIRLIRPALNAFWKPELPKSEWDKANAVFTRDAGGNGKWTFHRALPESWEVLYGGFKLRLKMTGFGHLGFFAEQYANWDFYRNTDLKGGAALNLFAYSGIASMAMAQSGAKVCHLDAAKGMIEWGRINQTLNPSVPDRIRWIADDVMRFVGRELRRGSRYSLIALDPPTFGRGSSGQVWKIEVSLPQLLEQCRQLRDPERDFHIVLSCHSPGFSVLVLERLLREAFGGGTFESTEMTIPESTGRVLPAGISVRCHLKKGEGFRN